MVQFMLTVRMGGPEAVVMAYDNIYGVPAADDLEIVDMGHGGWVLGRWAGVDCQSRNVRSGRSAFHPGFQDVALGGSSNRARFH